MEKDHENHEDSDEEVTLDPLAESLLGTAEAQQPLNESNDKMPYGYFSPESEGKLKWICARDQEGKITSIFYTDEERRVAYLKDDAEAKFMRDELVSHGWQKLKPPKFTFSMNGQNDGKPLNRKQRRYLARKIKSSSAAAAATSSK